MKNTVLFLATLLAVPALNAGGLSKTYKNWDRSPEAYFLTRAERAQWKTVKTDAEAQNFILDYKSKRGPEWEKTLHERVAAADKYFSSGETKGSETLRGRIIILFGPPSSLDAGGGKGKSGANSGDAATLSGRSGQDGGRGVGGGAGAKDDGLALSSGGASPIGSAPRHMDAPTMTFIYDEQAAPRPIGKPFKIEVKMISNAYQETWDSRDLEEKTEAVAQASIASAPPDSK